MDKVFQKFLRSGIDLSPVGVERREDNNPYFCTPKGASIFGWAGVDGIHFCFVRDFGGMVFSVSPMNSAPDFVHPLANDFEDFLRLLLACSDSAALEQAWMWDKAQFEAFLQDNPPTQDQQRTLSELAEKMKLTPMEQPWVYIKKLQASFDYSKIKYTEDYYDVDMNPEAEPTMPEWKVYFEGNFWGHSGKDHAGTEIRLNKQFDWARHHWVIPAAYYIIVWEVPKGAGKIGIINQNTNAGWLPQIAGKQYLLTILVVAVLTVLTYIYLKYSKHGYEIAVVGESQRTASYAGIKVERVIIRTMVLSGAMCGLMGLLLTAGTDHTLTTTIVGGRGFTAVMVSWMAKFNPIMMIFTSLLLVVLSRGASEISSVFGLNHSFADILTGIILFFIIGSEFFINYKVSLRKAGKKEA